MSPAGEKQWTVLAYMAGDNNLSDAALADLHEMKKLGSTPEVDVVAQLDRSGKTVSKRYHLRQGSDLGADAVGDVGETNTGDPAVLESFLRWGMKAYPAKKYLVILWNHGAGWDDEDIYRTARSEMGLGITRRGQVVPPSSRESEETISVRRVRTVGSKPLRRALFKTTIASALRPGAASRAIAFDDTSKDFLDNIEMKKVLTAVTKDLGRKIDILGMDACLMSMAEVAYQVRDSVAITVGSEEVEPSDGWPYDAILKELASQPEMTPEELAVLIVRKYVASYASDSDVTQAACDLNKCGSLAGAMDQLAKALIPGFSDPTVRSAIFEARERVQDYDVQDYVDLYNFCDLLARKISDGPVRTACHKVMETILKPGFVLDSGFKGTRMQHSYGVSVYFPRKEISPLYATLDLTREIAWQRFLKKYSDEKRQPDRGAETRDPDIRSSRTGPPA
ncbi:MAG: clostripain-related cysteine peptidase [Acidobacteria bacterium]|nr:clostripain-related cysteine peptidase [Acidobacteriota bacterium]